MGIALLLAGMAMADAPVATPDLLKDKYVAPGSECQGWGRWETPSVLANSDIEAVHLLGGAITIPPMGVVVHPGQDRDVSVAWKSPIAGKVNVRAKVVHAHPSGGDGVTWTVAHAGQAGRKVLAQGVIERGGSVAVEGGMLLGVSVRQGDALGLAIGPRGSHQCDSTAIEFTVTEIGEAGRVWDLAKDIARDLHAGNPHADSFGNKEVWHLAAPPAAAGGQTDEALTAALPKAGPTVESWTVATTDTKLTIGATKDGQLVLSALSNPATGWSWIREPMAFPLVDKATVRDTATNLLWKFKDAAADESSGKKVTVRFACEAPALELSSEWWARPGPGPVRHAMTLVNRSSEPVTVPLQPSVHLMLSGPTQSGTMTMWSFHTDGATPDRTGVYRHEVRPGFEHTVVAHPDGKLIPYAVFDADGAQGIYVGIEWSYCRISAAATETDAPGTVRVRGGEFPNFTIRLAPGQTLEPPPCFVGAYKGDVDDAGNRLRRHLFAYSMPEIVRKDATYPKVQWNAFGATGDKPGSWNCVERKYYPMIDAIAPLGFEEVMLDVGWWKGGTSAPEPEGDPADWSSGMAKAAEYAHTAGMRFGLYWNKGENMASPEGRNRRIAHVKRLYDEHKTDMWRSDNTGGPVVGGSYAEMHGFYALLDQLYREIPNFQWENCSSGGRIKDFGAMKRAVKIFITDTYAEHHVRQAFYDSSFCLPAAQLEGCVGSTDGKFRPQGPAGMRFAFRSTSLGAPEWFIDAPTGMNGSAPWTDEEKAAVKAAVSTFKTRIRPLVRNADLYHILPRPDGKNWDGIQYHDPVTGKGVVYLFKPAAVADTITLKLRGVEPAKRYRVSFEDGSNPAIEKTGADLAKGLDVTLKGMPVSELVWIEETGR
jgi:hypothetical protein